MEINLEIFSQETASIFLDSIRLALQAGHRFVGSEHLLWALSQTQGTVSRILHTYGLDSELIEQYLEKYDWDAKSDSECVGVQVSEDAEQVIHFSERYALNHKHKELTLENLLYGILAAKGCAAVQLMLSLEINLDEMRSRLTSLPPSATAPQTADNKISIKEKETLSKYGTDMTQKSRDGTYDPVIGRENTTERLIQILSRRTKNNPVLIGEPGVGKTAVVEGLAQRIADGNVPANLENKRIISLDLVSLLAGTKYRGDFEERMKRFFSTAESEGDIIVFIDELHMIIGAGAGDGAMDAANILKPVLARGTLQIIGATTPKEYRRYIERDVALERRFQPVEVSEPNIEVAIKILNGLRPAYERFHGLKISDAAIKAAVVLSDRYVQDRFLPDKAVDLMDEAASRVRIRRMSLPPDLLRLDGEIKQIRHKKEKAAEKQDYENAALFRNRQMELEQELGTERNEWQKKQGNTVEAEDVAQVMSSWTKIPVTMLTVTEAENLKRLEEYLHNYVIGQDEAVAAVAKAIRRGRTGVADPERPIGSFLFLGPTGVGKTELCRVLSKVMFHSEDAMIRFDMSEYMEPHTVSKLIGSPPGYVGYDEGGLLTESVRKRPYSILLFDEIEKSHPDIWNALLQILDDGRLTDAKGRTVSFKNTVIVMTSNLGAREIAERSRPMGFALSEETEEAERQRRMQQHVMESVKQTFRPEFLNRLDEIILFHPLKKKDVRKIVDIQLQKLVDRLKHKGICLNVQDSVREFLAEKGFDPVYGARPLRRAIQSTLQNTLADILLDLQPEQQKILTASVREGHVIVEAKTEMEKQEEEHENDG